MNAVLLKHGYLIANIEADEDTRNLYYQTLKESITKENKDDFIQFVAQIEKESLKKHIGFS
jgi:hypothetical protein